MPMKGKVTTLPGYALPPDAFHDIHNFTYDTRKTIGLMPGWTEFYASINGNPIMVIDQFYLNDGSAFFLVADTEDYYLYDEIAGTFGAVGPAAHFTGDYTNIFSTDVWPEAGAELFLSVNNVDRVQKYDGTATGFVDLVGLDDAEPGGVDVETAKIVRNFNEFVVLLHPTEDGDVYPFRVRWCKKGYPEVWKNDPVTGLGEAGFSDLTETTDWLVGAERLNYYLVIYKERSIYLMEYIGAPTVMRITRLVDGVGLLGPKCVAIMGDSHIILGNDNVYEVTTSSFLPIGDAISNELFGLMNPEKHDQIVMFTAEESNEIILAFPSTSSDTPDMFYVYNYAMKTWTGPHDRNSTAFGYYQSIADKTWDSLAGSWTDQLGYWDERIFQTNAPLNMMGDYAGKIYTLYDGYDAAGTAYDGYLEWGISDFGIPEKMKRLQKIWLSVDSANVGNVIVYVGYTDNTDNAVAWYGPITKAMTGQSLEIDVDVTARYFVLRIETSAGAPFALLGATLGFIERESTR